MDNNKSILHVGVEEKLPFGQNLIFAFQHLLALTGIWIFPVLIGQALGLEANTVGIIIQACFITTGIVTITQSSRMLKLPIVQGPTAAFFAAVISSGATVGLGTTFGSMTVAGIIFMLLAIPHRKWGIMGHLIKLVAHPLVYGTLLIIIGAYLATVGLINWFGTNDGGLSFITSIVTVVSILAFIVFGGNSIIRRGALVWGIIVGTIFFSIFGSLDFSAVSTAQWVNIPQVYPFGFGVSIPIVILMLMMYLQAGTEAIGLYRLVAEWANQDLKAERVNRGLFGEFLGCTIGSMFGGLGTTSYPENIGIVRISGIGSRFVTMTAGIIAVVLGLIPKVGILIASLPPAVLGAASTILFGIIAASGIQMVSNVVWDELNLAVAGTSIIISLGTIYLPAEITDSLSPAMNSVVTQPMFVGLLLLIFLNTLVNMIIRPWLEERRSSSTVSPTKAG